MGFEPPEEWCSFDFPINHPFTTNMKSVVVLIIGLFFLSCTHNNEPVTATEVQARDSVIAISNSAHFITNNYIELDKIGRISLFRSGIGHDYSDDVEHCRSMKHYFVPKENVDWASVKIFSPVSGIVVRMFDEWAGTQVQIVPFSQPSYTVIIFHINLLSPLSVGDTVDAGVQLGTHIGSQTYSDIAVGHSVMNTWQLVSLFDVINDSVFAQFHSRGIESRNQCIISKEMRDADTLGCNGDTFSTEGTLNNWIDLN